MIASAIIKLNISTMSVSYLVRLMITYTGNRTHQMKVRENGSGLKPRIRNMPPNVQLQREAWIAFTEDKAVKAPTRLRRSLGDLRLRQKP